MPTRYAVNLRDMPTFGKGQVATGKCPEGHDITDRSNLRMMGRSFRCALCWAEKRGPALCRTKGHPLPAGQRNCPTCAKDAVQTQKDVSYLFVGLPPSAVIEGAACGPESARLFDTIERPGPITGGAHVGQLPEETLAAMRICEGCPVKTACLSDALEWRREGVWGGAYFTQRWHQANRSARLQGTKAPELRTRKWAAERAKYRSGAQVTIESRSTVA